MRLRHIEAFHAIYLCGSISGAARLLNVSQPSLSKTLRHAEDQLRFTLFRRVRGRLVPTDEAHALFTYVNDVYEKLDALKQAARNLRTGEGRHIRLAVLPAIGLAAAPAAIARFRKDNPDVTFDVRTCHHDEAFRALNDRTCELAVVFEPSVHARFTTIRLGEGELVVIGRPSDFEGLGDRVPLSALGERGLVNTAASGPLGKVLNTRLADLAGLPREVASAHTFYVAAALVREGVGVSIVDEFTARAMAGERLTFRALEPPLRFAVSAVHLEDRPLSHLASLFVEVLRKELGQRRNP